MISQEYRRENQLLHEKPGYGSSGHLWLGHVAELCDKLGATSVLDYGCGKGTLKPYLNRLGITCTNYDPATFPNHPKGKSDLVVCLDVLEHIEPDQLPFVLDDLARHMGKALFANVSTRAATKTLSDGRNAHLIIKDWNWWKPVLLSHGFKCARIRQRIDSFDLVGYRQNPKSINHEQLQLLRGKT